MLRRLHEGLGQVAVKLNNLVRAELTLGVRLIALDDAGRVFLVRHSYVPGFHLPGGAVDLGETCAQAAEREAREEGNLVLAEPPGLFHLYWSPSPGRRDHIALFVAQGARQSAPRSPSLEIREAGFHRPDALPDGTTNPTRRRIAEVVGGAAPLDAW